MTAFPTPQQAAATVGVVAALRSLNAASVAFLQAYGEWPRFTQSVARILTQPLESVELDAILDVGVLRVVSGSE